MTIKKLVSYSLFALGTARLAFSLVHHLTGHEVTLIEIFEALPFLSAGIVLHVTNVHKKIISISQNMQKSVEVNSLNAVNYAVAGFFRRLSMFVYKYPELNGLDALNYFITKLTISFSQRFRKTHTGMLSYNMLAVLIGIILLLILLFR